MLESAEIVSGGAIEVEYRELAYSYDRLTEDVDYEAIYSYLCGLMEKRGKRPQSVLDLGCGTASLSILFSKGGLSVTAVDISEEMLTRASQKAAVLPPLSRPRFICCPMQSLKLPYRVDFAVSSLDSLNYLISPKDLQETLQRIFAMLNSGGMLVFDLISPSRFMSLDGQVFLDEDDDVYCIWRSSFDNESRIMTYGMDLFQREGKLWKRSQECHEEYAYEPETVVEWLDRIGYKNIKIYGDRSFSAPAEKEDRLWIAAEKE